MRPGAARGLGAALLLVPAGVTLWLLVATRGGAWYEGFLEEQLLVGVWPLLALPLALLGRPHAVLVLFLPYLALSMLFGLGIGGTHVTLGAPAYLLALAALYRDRTIRRRPLAFGVALALVGLVVAGVFAAITHQCGIMKTEEVRPGEPDAPSVCVSRLHPMSLVLGAAALASIVALLARRPEVPLVLGLAFGLLGFPLVFSGGAWAWLVGASLVAAAAVRWRPEGRPAPPT